MNFDQTIVVEEDIKLKLESIKEEKIDSPEINAEPLDINEEPSNIKGEFLEVKKEPLDTKEEIDYQFQTGVDVFELLHDKELESKVELTSNKEEKIDVKQVMKILANKWRMKRHISDKRSEMHSLNVHEKKKPYNCFVCGKAFGQKRSLKQHSDAVHVGK